MGQPGVTRRNSFPKLRTIEGAQDREAAASRTLFMTQPSAEPVAPPVNKPVLPPARIHIAGICGTFMAGVATMAKELGFQVAGSDGAVYPPMDRQLHAAKIPVHSGFDVRDLDPRCELVIMGNVMSRGMPFVEAVLKKRIPLMSGPQWLAQYVLPSRLVIAVSGTHGKTTTASMLAWILQDCGLEPGFLIGGVPGNFSVCARLGKGKYFVVEADEYDSAYFDKRPKFLHFHPDLLILNNLEYDHADIFEDLAALELQFAWLLRNVRSDGVVITRAQDAALERVIARGNWARCVRFGYADEQEPDWAVAGSGEERWLAGKGSKGKQAACRYPAQKLCGEHNLLNATAAVAAACEAGIAAPEALAALANFRGVARRLEVISKRKGITVYDDFAHHPTAIEASVKAVRSVSTAGRVLAVFEPRSNTMKLGTHNSSLASAFAAASRVYCYCPPTLGWSLETVFPKSGNKFHCFRDTESLLQAVTAEAREKDHVLVMSNGHFANLPARLAAFYA